MTDNDLKLLALAFIEKKKLDTHISALEQALYFLREKWQLNSTVHIDCGGGFMGDIGVSYNTLVRVEEGFDRLPKSIQKDLVDLGIIPIMENGK